MIVHIDRENLKKILDILIGDSSDEFCGCMEGDIANIFSTKKMNLIEEILNLLESQEI